MPEVQPRFHVITGGPGSGKTSLLAHLAGQGMAIMPEAGRGIIRAQMDVDGPALPWRNPALFAELMFGWEMRSYEAAKEHFAPVLFDRGLPDIVGYLQVEGLEISPHIRRAAAEWRYNRVVFIAPPWPEIFHQDSERRQTMAEAERTYEVMRQVYAALDYSLLELPRASIEARCAFLIAHLEP